MNMADKPQTPDEKLQHEFNRWAADGEGAKMERHHLDITEKTIRLMNLRPGERVLDLGCGSGWATRLLARLVGEGPEGFGQVVGLDVSDEMVRQAREASKDFENILYVWGSAQPDSLGRKLLRQSLVGRIVLLLSRSGSCADGVISRDGTARTAFYSDQSLQGQFRTRCNGSTSSRCPVHVRSADEYVELLKKHAFEDVQALRVPDDTPTPDDYQTKSFNSLDDLRAFKREGALLLMASKPDLRTPLPGVHDLLISYRH